MESVQRQQHNAWPASGACALQVAYICCVHDVRRSLVLIYALLWETQLFVMHSHVRLWCAGWYANLASRRGVPIQQASRGQCTAEPGAVCAT